MFGYVKRERLKESEQFWRDLFNEANDRSKRVLEKYSEMTDKYVAQVRENESLKAQLATRTTAPT